MRGMVTLEGRKLCTGSRSYYQQKPLDAEVNKQLGCIFTSLLPPFHKEEAYLRRWETGNKRASPSILRAFLSL
ncbi:hypothetical protein ACOSQ2_013546 [Xanthoceras sorbifolium]